MFSSNGTESGDHGPIHYSQIEEDQPMFRLIWTDPEAVDRIEIDIENYKKSPEIWLRRFKLDDARK